MRRQRIKSPVSVTSIKRLVSAATKAGLSVTSLEVRANGTIAVGTTEAVNDVQPDVFAQWADRL